MSEASVSTILKAFGSVRARHDKVLTLDLTILTILVWSLSWRSTCVRKKQVFLFLEKKNTYIWKGEDFSRWIQVEFLKLGWRTPKDQKGSLKNFKFSFSTIVPFIYKKNVYRDDKLEDDWKCKTSRKTKWSLEKKWKRNIFFGKNRKLPTKIFIWKKKNYFKTHPIHMTMFVGDVS